MNYLDQLSTELGRAGIGGGLRRRILAEIGDHLESAPEADLGTPDQLARQFADELGTGRARRAALTSFVALAVAGLLCGVAVVAMRSRGIRLPPLHPSSRPLAILGLGLAAIGAQLAFVAGTLAALRAFRHRHDRVLARAQSTVIARRAAVGLAAGLATMIGAAIVIVEYRNALPNSLQTLGFGAAAVGAAALAAAAPSVVSAARLRTTAPGEPEDLLDDLGPTVTAVLRGRIWPLVLATVGTITVLAALTGAIHGDGPDGLARGIVDGAACLLGFVMLGRYLGLRD